MPERSLPSLVWQGEDCLCLRWPARIDPPLNRQVHLCAARLQAAEGLPGVVDLVPAYASLAIYFDAGQRLDRPRIEAAVGALLAATEDPASAATAQPPIELPVCYDPALAPDLEDAARRLSLTVAELIERHTAPVYQVAMLGFAPGFPYLLGMDPALALPRHEQPRAEVAAGSVGIAGAQTGIYPQASPGGWQLIGRTPWRLFDAGRQPPARLTPGQRLRFVAIGRERFDQLSAECAT